MEEGNAKEAWIKLPHSISRNMKGMSDCCLRVAIVVADKTVGRGKKSDEISISQFVEATGLSDRGVKNGIADALEKGIVKRKPKRKNNVRGGFIYELAKELRSKEDGNIVPIQKEKKDWKQHQSELAPADEEEYGLMQRPVSKRTMRRKSFRRAPEKE